MKTQMRFQKILTLVTLIIAAFSVVYALIFCSGIMMQISAILEFDSIEDYGDQSASGANALYNASQSFSDLFLILGIVLIVAVVLLYITACQKRRKYYVTNYVAIGVVLAYMLVYVILLIVNVLNVQSAFNNLNAAQCEYYYTKYSNAYGKWTTNTWMISLGYAYAAILVVNMVAIVLNLVWKIKLMQGEKKLLESGLVKEVA